MEFSSETAKINVVEGKPNPFEVGGVNEEKMERALALEQAKIRLSNFKTENIFESLAYSLQAEKLKNYLEQIVDTLQEMTAVASNDEADINERYVLRLLVEEVARELHALHQVVNFMNEVDEPERFLIS